MKSNFVVNSGSNSNSFSLKSPLIPASNVVKPKFLFKSAYIQGFKNKPSSNNSWKLNSLHTFAFIDYTPFLIIDDNCRSILLITISFIGISISDLSS